MQFLADDPARASAVSDGGSYSYLVSLWGTIWQDGDTSIGAYAGWDAPAPDASCFYGQHYTSQSYVSGTYADGCGTPDRLRTTTLTFSCGPDAISTVSPDITEAPACELGAVPLFACSCVPE